MKDQIMGNGLKMVEEGAVYWVLVIRGGELSTEK